MTWDVRQGHVLDLLRQMPDASVHCVVTSPPYWGLRDYGVDGQLGLEKTPDAYVARMVEVFREVRRVLRDDGTLWLNLGDSYAGSWGNYGGKNRGRGMQRNIVSGSAVHQEAYDGLDGWRPPASFTKDTGLKPKDLVGIPWRLAFALQADGWYLRSDIIWSKPNPMPESVTDRPTKSHEYLFLMAKSERYYFDQNAVREEQVSIGKVPLSSEQEKGSWHDHSDDLVRGQRNARPCVHPLGRNIRTVWTIATYPFPEAHFATFPEKLVEPCIRAGCPQGGVVLDPFCGSGTTGVVALKLQRSFIGIDLNAEYVAMARRRIGGTMPLFSQEVVST